MRNVIIILTLFLLIAIALCSCNHTLVKTVEIPSSQGSSSTQKVFATSSSVTKNSLSTSAIHSAISNNSQSSSAIHSAVSKISAHTVSVLTGSKNPIISSQRSDSNMTDTQILEERFGIKLPRDSKIIKSVIDKTHSFKSNSDTIYETICSAKISIFKSDIEPFVKSLRTSYGQRSFFAGPDNHKIDQIPYINKVIVQSVDWWDMDENGLKYYYSKYLNSPLQPGVFVSKSNSASVFIVDSGGNNQYIYLDWEYSYSKA